MKKLLPLVLVLFNILSALLTIAQTPPNPLINIRGLDGTGTTGTIVKGVIFHAFYNDCGQLAGTPYSSMASNTPAGNCFAYALYVGQGGPYHGSYKFALAFAHTMS